VSSRLLREVSNASPNPNAEQLARWAERLVPLLLEGPTERRISPHKGLVIPRVPSRLKNVRARLTPADRKAAQDRRRNHLLRHCELNIYQATESYLTLDTQGLLSAFGKGNPTPGGGSACALGGAVAARLLESVCRLTRSAAFWRMNSPYSLDEASLTLRVMRPLSARLEALVDEDARMFAMAMREGLLASCSGNSAVDRIPFKDMQPAVEIPLEVSRLTQVVGLLSLVNFDRGYMQARGDSASAASMAMAASEGAIMVSSLNLIHLKSAPSIDSSWFNRKTREVRLLASTTEMLRRSFTALMRRYLAEV
jgi:formiminotetrahydrofolate cyclodeaminase